MEKRSFRVGLMAVLALTAFVVVSSQIAIAQEKAAADSNVRFAMGASRLLGKDAIKASDDRFNPGMAMVLKGLQQSRGGEGLKGMQGYNVLDTSVGPDWVKTRVAWSAALRPSRTARPLTATELRVFEELAMKDSPQRPVILQGGLVTGVRAAN